MNDDPEYSEHDDENESNGMREARKRIKALEAELKKAAEAETRAEAAERKLAVADAGIKLSDKQLKALASVHDGEWTPDAIKATAADLGYIATPEPEVPAEELAALDRVSRAASGSGASKSKQAEYDELLAQTKSTEEVLELAKRFGSPLAADFG